ncbi:hypothetical protein [Rugosimonospora africana]|uniref:hypothetical protein n=1 Tax=Rugosimonospora africana TaxID=556532 RepID=UPI001941C7A0|nr:hypothetical protein [Rugosimonospora africana]
MSEHNLDRGTTQVETRRGVCLACRWAGTHPSGTRPVGSRPTGARPGPHRPVRVAEE